ncbi:MAG: hypothetical protein ACLTDR_07765 [Adlercreutzia equolifaciens]
MRQPYSVDAVSQAIGEVVFENRARFRAGHPRDHRGAGAASWRRCAPCPA